MRTIILGLCVAGIFLGCSCKAVPFVKCETIFVENNETTVLPTKGKTKPTFCDEEGSLQTNVFGEVLRCIYELREAKKICE